MSQTLNPTMTRYSRNRSPSTARTKKDLKDAEETKKKKSMSILTTAPIHTKIDIQVSILIVLISPLTLSSTTSFILMQLIIFPYFIFTLLPIFTIFSLSPISFFSISLKNYYIATYFLHSYRPPIILVISQAYCFCFDSRQYACFNFSMFCF